MALHPHLEAARDRLGLELPGLEASAEFSQRQTAEARAFFARELGLDEPLDIVVCGSLARQEMSGASDFDYLIVAHGLAEDATTFRAYRQACDKWCTLRAIKPPGVSDIFGKVVSATDLVEQIGLEFDTNRSLTRRILLLEEGCSVLEPSRHRRFVRVAIGRYLDGDRVAEHTVPRFLLNDLARYWRTIAVDYQAKVWQRLQNRDWGIRYLKLRVSRKLTFAGSLVPLFLIAMRRPEDPVSFLTDQYTGGPPLARIAQLVEDLDGDAVGLAHVGRILTIADRFVNFLADQDRRELVEHIGSPAEAESVPEFAEMRDLSGELQDELAGLFLDSTLGPLGRKYLSF